MKNVLIIVLALLMVICCISYAGGNGMPDFDIANYLDGLSQIKPFPELFNLYSSYDSEFQDEQGFWDKTVGFFTAIWDIISYVPRVSLWLIDTIIRIVGIDLDIGQRPEGHAGGGTF